MDQIQRNMSHLEALKAFNNSIVTNRLYPSEAPQVSSAEERGYKVVKRFIREQNFFKLSFQEDLLCLNDAPIDQEELGFFGNLVVFRQLQLLELPSLLLGPELDRFAYGQLIVVFNASVEKVKQQEGGRSFVTSLGLSNFFPLDTIEQETFAEQNTQPKRLVKVRPALVNCLLGKDKRPLVQEELQHKMYQPEMAIEIFSATIATILKQIQTRKVFDASSALQLAMKMGGSFISADQQGEIARNLGGVLSQNLKESTLCVLLCQQFGEEFGGDVYEELVTALSQEKLAAIVILLREQLAKVQHKKAGQDDGHKEFLGRAFYRLMNTDRGKIFLSSEKAKQAIHEGEKQRRQKRLEAGLAALFKGQLTTLSSEELAKYLPHTFRQFVSKDRTDHAELLVDRMIAYLGQEDTGEYRATLASAVDIGEFCLENDNQQMLSKLIPCLLAAAIAKNPAEELYEKLIQVLQRIMDLSYETDENETGDKILALFYKIRSGNYFKPAPLKDIVAKVQDAGIDRARLPHLLAQTLVSPKDETLSHRLVLQGPVATRFLVEALITTEDTTARIKIIDLLTYSGDYVIPVIRERINGHMPWFGKRNLIKLLGDIGSEEDAEAVLPFFNHDDFRVQREAFLALYKIGGEHKKGFLIEALGTSSELIKIQIIEALGEVGDADVAKVLAEELQSHHHFSEENRETLLLQIVDSLALCSCNGALTTLQSFLLTKGQRSTKYISETVWGAAEKAIAFLETGLKQKRKKHLHASQLRKNALKQATKLSKTSKIMRVITGLPQEQQVKNLLSKNNTEAAVVKLNQLIEITVRAKKFGEAEKLKDWLLEIEPGAVDQVIKVSDSIERAKEATLDTSHLEIWSALYDVLSTEEFQEIFHNLQHNDYGPEEVVVVQGAMQSSLFFINRGKVKLYYEELGGEVLIRTLESGEIFGAGAFFDASVWTISVASVGTSDISSLKVDKLESWRQEFPELEEKLQNFCKQFERVDQFFDESSRDRREHERFAVTAQITASLVDSRGRSTGVETTGELHDISLGGVSYHTTIEHRDNVRQFLGRKVSLGIPSGMLPGETTTVTGDILAVRKYQKVVGEYTIHVRFDSLLEEEFLKQCIQACRRESLHHT